MSCWKTVEMFNHSTLQNRRDVSMINLWGTKGDGIQSLWLYMLLVKLQLKTANITHSMNERDLLAVLSSNLSHILIEGFENDSD